MFDSLWPHDLQHVKLPYLSLSPRVCSSLCPWVIDAIQLPHPLSPSSPLALSLPQDQGLFQVGCYYQVAKVMTLPLQHQCFQWVLGLISFRVDWLQLLAVQRIFKSHVQHHNSKASILWCSAFFIVQLHTVDYWKRHSFDYVFVSKDFLIHCLVCHSFSSKEQMSFNFTGALTICSDF